MDYNWDIQKIRNLKRKHIELLRKTSGLTLEEKNGITEQIEKLKQMEEELNPSFLSLPTFPKEKYVDKDKLLSQETLNSYFETPKFIREIIGKSLPLFQDFKETSYNYALPKKKQNNEEIVNLSHDFYKWLYNGNYEQLFLHYTNPNHHLLRFKKMNSTESLLGETIFFYYPQYLPFIQINKEGNSKDFLTLNHEIAHSIFYIFENNNSYNTDHYFLLELEGSYFDFLSLEFLKERKVITKQEIQTLEYLQILAIIQSFRLFYINYLKILSYKKINQISIEFMIEKSIEHGLSDFISISSIDMYTNVNIKKEAKYIISFLTSLDLIKLYKENPTTAFQTFLQVRENQKKDIQKILIENGISCIKKEYQLLNDSLQKLKRIKKQD